MRRKHKFVLSIMSASVEELFDSQNGKAPFADKDDRKYLDVGEFDSFIQDLPDYRCANEFRIAKRVIQEYINKSDSEEISYGLYVVAQAFDILAEYRYPVNFPPLEKIDMPDICSFDKNETPTANTKSVITPAVVRPTLPSVFTNCAEDVHVILQSLEESAYLNSNYMPCENTPKYLSAYMAYLVGGLFGIKKWSKIFGEYWGITKLNENRKNCKHGDRGVIDINTALKATVAKCSTISKRRAAEIILNSDPEKVIDFK